MDDLDEVGGGSKTGVILKGKAVALHSDKVSANVIQEKLRKSEVPVICHIRKDKVLLNVRTLQKKDFNIIVNALRKIAGE